MSKDLLDKVLGQAQTPVLIRDIKPGLSLPVITLEDKNVEIRFGEAAMDAFGRQRVSNPETLFDSKQIFDNAPLFWDDSEVSGAGTTSVYTKDTASTVIGVANVTAGKRIRQTFMRFNYQPGKSQLVFMTGTIDENGGGGTGIVRAMGIFDDNNGVFIQDDEGVVTVVIRGSTTGSAVDNKVVQSDWNIDRLDGTGESGITLNVSRSQILIIDFEWLAVGRVRIGFIFSGVITYCHQFNHANILSGAYMSTPNLPLRYEIENTGAGQASMLEHICATVISEGGAQDNGILRHDSTEGTVINANVANTIYAICAIRLKTTHIGASIKLVSQSMLATSNDDFEWLLILNPTVANAVTFNDVANSAIQFAVGNVGNPSDSTVTGGVHFDGGFVNGGASSGDIASELENAILLGSQIDGTVDEIYLCCRPLTSNADINGGMAWRELS